MQKKAIRVITKSKFSAHTSPLFKKLNLLKVGDIYHLQCLKLHFKIENNIVPYFFQSFTIRNWNVHTHLTRGRQAIRPTGIKSNWLRHFIPELVLKTPDHLLDLIHTSTIATFTSNIRKNLISFVYCTKRICVICDRSEPT